MPYGCLSAQTKLLNTTSPPTPMPHVCTTCAHPELEQIDRALLANEPLRRIGARFDLSPSALSRHRRNHLEQRAEQGDLSGRVEELERRVTKLHRSLVKLLVVLRDEKERVNE